ncbi:alpha/beta fold hydrolase [Paenibacillus sp. GCM10027628]|uniref:alpha/beta fold hydrolase n=1 Tax=Paenibacillus sp. GCM10027628 TaxID=3273413 RepID=UPI00363B847F
MPFAHVNGTTLYYEITGKGTPIVFIHPPLLTSENFAYQREQLADDFQIITFDIRGHGKSNPSDRTISYSLIVEDIRQLLDFVGIEKAFLCGYSTGGSLVLEALLMYPKRFLGGIVVSGMSEISDVYNKSSIWLASQMFGSIFLKKLLLRAIAHGNADKDETYHHLFWSSLKTVGGIGGNVRQYFQCSLTYNCTHRLSTIGHPMLLIFGQEDHRFLRYGKLLRNRLPHSSLYLIKDAKHQIPTKNAERMNDLIRLWIPSLQDQQTERVKLDLEIARKLNPAMYGQNELSQSMHLS